MRSEEDALRPGLDEISGDDDGARLSLLYNGIHRFDVSRVKPPVEALLPPGPGPEVCCVICEESFACEEAPPVAAAATARFSSVSREIFRRILDNADVFGKRSFPFLLLDSSDAFEVVGNDELTLTIELRFNCRREAGI